MSPEALLIKRLHQEYSESTGLDLVEDMDLVGQAVRRLKDPEEIQWFRREYLEHLQRSSSELIRDEAGYHTISDVRLAVQSMQYVDPDQGKLWKETLNDIDFEKGVRSPRFGPPGPLR